MVTTALSSANVDPAELQMRVRAQDGRSHRRRRFLADRITSHGGEIQRPILVQDAILEFTQLARRVDPELLHEQLAAVSIDRECVGLATAPIQRQHEMSAQTLVERVVGHPGLEFIEHLTMVSGGKLRLRCLFHDRDAFQLQSRGHSGVLHVNRQPGQRLTAPEAQRRSEGDHRRDRPAAGACLFALPAQGLEPQQIALVVAEFQEIPGTLRADQIVPETL